MYSGDFQGHSIPVAASIVLQRLSLGLSLQGATEEALREPLPSVEGREIKIELRSTGLDLLSTAFPSSNPAAPNVETKTCPYLTISLGFLQTPNFGNPATKAFPSQASASASSTSPQPTTVRSACHHDTLDLCALLFALSELRFDT